MEIKKELQKVKDKLAPFITQVECYLFGSILTKANLANDIDIIIVYQNIDNITLIKQSLISLSSIYPLHIIYLSYDEEKEFNFIIQQNAEKVFSL